MSKFTEEEMKNFEALYRLKDMKLGERITQHHLDGVRHFFGAALDQIGEPKSTTIHFDKDTGLPTHTTGEDIIGEVKVDGKAIPMEHRSE